MKELDEQKEYLPFGEPIHYLQRDIVTKLKDSVKSLTYSELKPVDMDGNAFNHHLKNLVEKKLVNKMKNGEYGLSQSGRLMIDSQSRADSRIKTRPLNGVFILARTVDGKLLTYTSLAGAVIGYEGLLFGKLRLSQTYKETASRMLKYRNIDEDRSVLESPGMLNIRYTEGGELVAHRCGPLYIVRLDIKSEEVKDFGSSKGRVSWIDEDGKVPKDVGAARKLSTSKGFGLVELEIK